MFLMDFVLNITYKVVPIALSLIGLGLLITIHEFGHFFFCKLFSVHTPTFSIGFGPQIFHKKIGHTNFRLAAIPFGGYVEIAGLAETGQGDQEHAKDTSDNSFDKKWYWQKFLILIGGILFNLLFAYIVFCSLTYFTPSSKTGGIRVAQVMPNSAAEKYGVMAGDLVVGINQTQFDQTDPETYFDFYENMLKTIRANPGSEIALQIKRGDEIKTLAVMLESKTEAGKEFGRIGTAFEIQMPQMPLFKSIKMGIKQANATIVGLVLGIKKMFSSRSLDGTMGPVMIISQGADIAKAGFLPLLMFLALLSISLAVMNVLPIGALDGGQILFATIEAIIRRKIPDMIKLIINLASWILFLGLALYLSVQELRQLFGPSVKSLIAKIYGFIR